MTTAKTDNSVTPAAPPRPTVNAANRAALGAWCDLARGIETFRGRWKASILMALAGGPKPLADLRKALPGPARRVMIRALREMQGDGLVLRDGPDAQPRYGLSARGEALSAILADVAGWAGTLPRAG